MRRPYSLVLKGASRTICVFACCLAATQFASAVAAQTTVHDAWHAAQPLAPVSVAQSASTDAAPPLSLGDDVWRVDVYGWLWLSGMDGTVGARGFSGDVDLSFGDMLEKSDSLLGLSARFEIGKGRWAGYVDGVFTTIRADELSGPVGASAIDVSFSSAVIDFGALYRAATWECNAGADNHMAPRVTLDVYAGARYQYLDLELDPLLLPSRSADRDWLDPVLGARLTAPLNAKFHVMTSADVGGFGASSEFTWSALAVVGYGFSLFDSPATLYAGYRALATDYESGTGASAFVWDVTVHGPLLGLGVRF